jgi:hypothetical protein
MGKSGVQKGMKCSPTKRESKIKITVSHAKTKQERQKELSEAEKLRQY